MPYSAHGDRTVTGRADHEDKVMTMKKDDLGNVVIEFSDGRELNFGGGTRPDGKRRPDVKAHKVVDVPGGRVSWYFATGDMRVVNVERFAEAIQKAFVLHGVSQKLGDCYASSTTAAEALEQFNALLEQLDGGSWEKPTREGSGASDGGMLAQAVAKVLGCSVADAAATLKAMEGKERKALELEPDIAKELAAIRKAKSGNADPAGVRGKLEGLLKRKSAGETETDDGEDEEALM